MYERRENIEIDFFLDHKIGHKELKSIVQFSFHNILTHKKNKMKFYKCALLHDTP